jgi:hypothetical protein
MEVLDNFRVLYGFSQRVGKNSKKKKNQIQRIIKGEMG